MIIPIEPVAKPRMVNSDKWRQRACVVRYYTFANQVRRHIKNTGYVPDRFTLNVKFIISMPQSWSKKKRNEMNDKPHLQRPDCDNLVKSILDAIFPEDKSIFRIIASKWWGETGKIVLSDIDNSRNCDNILG